MAQNFDDIQSTHTLQESRQKVLNRDITLVSHHSGTAFPTTNLYVGMTCFRTDQEKLYELRSIDPDTWSLIADLSKTYLSKEGADALYQALNAELTALAAVNTTGALERTGAATFATFTVTTAAKNLLDDASTAAMRTTLGLGTAATFDVGTGANNIPQYHSDGNLGIGKVPSGAKLDVNGTIKSTAGTLGSNGNGARTVSASAPSGGSDGDVWYQV